MIGEVPIIFENRRAGASKVNPREAVRSIAVLLAVGLQSLFGLDNPNEVFLPIDEPSGYIEGKLIRK